MKRFLTTAVGFLIPFAALAQQGEGQLSTNEAVPSLMLFTLGAGLVIAIGLLVLFLRRRSNRAAMERVIKDERGWVSLLRLRQGAEEVDIHY